MTARILAIQAPVHLPAFIRIDVERVLLFPKGNQRIHMAVIGRHFDELQRHL